MSKDRKKVNSGVIDTIYFKVINHDVAIQLPCTFHTSYIDNRSFIESLAAVYDKYLKDNDIDRSPENLITPARLAWCLARYNIKTNRGEEYVSGSRGPFNLIAAAYRRLEYLENCYKQTLKDPDCQKGDAGEFNRDMKNHWHNRKVLVAKMFVTTKNKYAWEE